MATATICRDRLAALLLCLSFASATAGAATPQFNYLLHCGGCHIEDGSGMGDVVPDLNEDLGYFASFPEGRSYLMRVPGAAHSPLTDGDLAEVLNWMLRSFAAADAPQPFTETEVSEHRRNRLDDVVQARKDLLELKDASVSMAPETSAKSPVPLTAEQQQAFGEALFFDTSLSRHGNQACASCHDPGRAFADPRSLSTGAGASIGSDGSSIGHRNAPSLTYIAATPVFNLQDTTQTSVAAQHRTPTRITRKPADSIRGGFFWDGREPTLERQVLTPFINAREMGLFDLGELAERVAGNERYQPYVGAGAISAGQQARVLASIADSLAAYLRSDTFNSFDSRYDRFVRGEINASATEMAGMGLFFSPGFTNCATCHQAGSTAYAPREPFTNHRYENIGTPINRTLLTRSDKGEDYRDAGLALNPALGDTFDMDDVRGRVKVPSLRNVAVTAPYMHNGTFSELDTVMRFYNHFNESGHSGQINPETGQPWAEANNPDGVATDKLRGGFPLSDRQLAALSAFLRMLTDQRYEHLLKGKGDGSKGDGGIYP
jgi:cytochrome c peroxidase